MQNQVKTVSVEFDSKIEIVLERIQPYLSKLGYKLANGAADPEDQASEIRVKVLMNLRNQAEAFQVLPVEDLVAISIAVARNFSVDMVRKAVRRPDTSKFAKKIEDQDLSTFAMLSEWGHQESNAITRDTYRKLIEAAQQEARLGSDLVRFIRELVAPTKYTLIYYTQWRELTSERNPHKNKRFIPAEVVGKALGFSPSKVSRMKERLGVLMVKMGYDVVEVFPDAYSYDDVWFLTKGIDAPKRAAQVGLDAPRLPRYGTGTVPASSSGEGVYLAPESAEVKSIENRVNGEARFFGLDKRGQRRWLYGTEAEMAMKYQLA